MRRTKVSLRDLVRTDRQLRALGLRGPGTQQTPGLVCHPSRVATANPGEEGYVVVADDLLVAVLVRVGTGNGAGQEGEEGGAAARGWHVEASFGPCRTPVPPLLDTLGEALAWVRGHLGPA